MPSGVSPLHLILRLRQRWHWSGGSERQDRVRVCARPPYCYLCPAPRTSMLLSVVVKVMSPDPIMTAGVSS